MAGAKIITKPNIPMAEPRFSGGNVVNNTFINNGIIIAAPEAWTILAINNTGKLGAKPPMKVPIANNPMAIRNNRLAVYF
ncbi:hypothetical protein D3C75_584560 [compost metagenome]